MRNPCLLAYCPLHCHPPPFPASSPSPSLSSTHFVWLKTWACNDVPEDGAGSSSPLSFPRSDFFSLLSSYRGWGAAWVNDVVYLFGERIVGEWQVGDGDENGSCDEVNSRWVVDDLTRLGTVDEVSGNCHGQWAHLAGRHVTVCHII